jgi:signal transduction histidine kinase/DNA-binding response OmpR family regulator/streptogramin lyase
MCYKLTPSITLLLFFFAFLFSSYECYAQRTTFYEKGYQVEHFGMENGFVLDEIYDLTQDKETGYLWMTNYTSLVRFDGYDFKFYIPDKEQKNHDHNDYFRRLVIDKNGYVWMRTFDKFLWRFDPITEVFEKYDLNKKGYFGNTCLGDKIVVDSSYNLWLGGGPNLLLISPDNATKIQSFYLSDIMKTVAESTGSLNFENLKNSDYCIVPYIDDQHQFWISSSTIGIGKITQREERKFEEFIIFVSPQDVPWESLFDIADFNEHYLVAVGIPKEQIEGYLSFWLVDKNNGGVTEKKIKTNKSCRNTFANTIYKDKRGSIWIGTYSCDGLYQLSSIDSKTSSLSNAIHFDLKSGFTTNDNPINILSIIEDDNNNLWMSTQFHGLFRINQDKDDLSQIDLPIPSIKKIIYDDIYCDATNQLWINIAGQGIIKYDHYTGTSKHFLEDDYTSHVFYESEESVHLGGRGGIWSVNKNTDQVSKEDLPAYYSNSFLTDGKRLNDSLCYLMLTPYNKTILNSNTGVVKQLLPEVMIRGAYRYNEEVLLLAGLNNLFQYNVLTDQVDTIERLSICTSIYRNNSGKTWLGSVLGFHEYEHSSDRLDIFEESIGETVLEIIEHKNYLWLFTYKGVIGFDPATSIFNKFNDFNDVGVFRQNVICREAAKDTTGRIWFLRENGIYHFHPDSIRDDPQLPILSLQDLAINNTYLANQDRRRIYDQRHPMMLDHAENNLTFSYVGVYLKSPKDNTYAHQLTGRDDDWQYVGTERTARFNGLAPGSYTFKVKAANPDGVWSQPLLFAFVVRPPWYWSWWTKTLYGLLCFGLVYTFYRFQLRRRLAESERLRLKELDDAKNQLYTNITHDFRTPLTIIQGMTEQIKSKQYAQEKRLIQRNTQKLLQMVNQILDLAKLESGKLNLQLKQSDIIAFLKNEMTAYIALATSQNIALQFQCETDQLEMDFDPFLMRQILANLLSNALKFIAEDGAIMVRVQKVEAGRSPQLLLAVEDTGKGIPEDQLDKIFDRYYQAPDADVYSTVGTGIGLAHTKELVGLMGGEVSVKSVLNVGSTFSLVLPITQKAVKISTSEISPAYFENTAVSPLRAVDKQTTVVENFDLPLVLIVEDNEDMIQYLIKCLQEDYRILTALNGAEGVKTALAHVPDLIISDVMMPEVDGFSLTVQLKNDERSSHIPIVLLTAKADQEAKIEGLQSGADTYIFKPFDRKEMLVRLAKLLELRKKLQQHYASPDQLELLSKEHLTIDEQFLKSVQLLIKEHLDDASYSVEQLAQDVNLSRAQLYRKIKALTDESVSAYMRLLRLTQAKKILQSHQFTVAEVAYKVGFNDPAYFSRCFSNLFGFPPSDI